MLAAEQEHLELQQVLGDGLIRDDISHRDLASQAERLWVTVAALMQALEWKLEALCYTHHEIQTPLALASATRQPLQCGDMPPIQRTCQILSHYTSSASRCLTALDTDDEPQYTFERMLEKMRETF